MKIVCCDQKLNLSILTTTFDLDNFDDLCAVLLIVSGTLHVWVELSYGCVNQGSLFFVDSNLTNEYLKKSIFGD